MTQFSLFVYLTGAVPTQHNPWSSVGYVANLHLQSLGRNLLKTIQYNANKQLTIQLATFTTSKEHIQLQIRHGILHIGKQLVPYKG